MSFDAKKFKFQTLSLIPAGRILRVRHGLGENYAVSARTSDGNPPTILLFELAVERAPTLSVFGDQPVIEFDAPFEIQLSKEPKKYSDSYSDDMSLGDIIATEKASYIVSAVRGRKLLLDLADFAVYPISGCPFAICSSWKIICFPNDAEKKFELYDYTGRDFRR